MESDSSEYEDVEEEGLAGVPEDEATAADQIRRNSSSKLARKPGRQVSHKARIASIAKAKGKSRSPSTDTSTLQESRSTSASINTTGKQSMASTDTSASSSWSHLPSFVQRHLEYHRQHLHHHHYMFKHDGTDFIRTTLLELALEYEPLLFAVVGFSAYHSSLHSSHGRIEDFLAYYNTSVQLLRKSLASESPHTDATILTILQLAAFEVPPPWPPGRANRAGIPRRLGQSARSPKGGLRNDPRALHARDDHGNGDLAPYHLLVHAF